MRVVNSMQVARNRAAEALKSVLTQVSQIKLKSIETNLPGPDLDPDLNIDILAQVDVCGRRQTLACKVDATGHADHILVALKQFSALAKTLHDRVTPVMIAPRLTEEAMALCRAAKIGCLDFEGNARLELGEVFIVRRMLAKPVQGSAPFTHSSDHALAGVA